MVTVNDSKLLWTVNIQWILISFFFFFCIFEEYHRPILTISKLLLCEAKKELNWNIFEIKWGVCWSMND